MTVLLAIKILLICLGCVYTLRGIMIVYTTTMKLISAFVHQSDWKFSFSTGWVWQTALSVAAIIIGIIL